MASWVNLSARRVIDEERGRHRPRLIPVVFLLQLSYTWLQNGNSPSRHEEIQCDPEREEKQTCFAKVVIWLFFWGCFSARRDKLQPSEPVRKSEKNILLCTADVCGCLLCFVLIRCVATTTTACDMFPVFGVFLASVKTGCLFSLWLLLCVKLQHCLFYMDSIYGGRELVH